MADEINNSITFDRELSEQRRDNDRYEQEVRARTTQLRAGAAAPAPAPAQAKTPARAQAASAPAAARRSPASAPAPAAQIDDAEARAKALASVMNRYHKVKDQFYLKDPQNTPAFKDKGEKLISKLDAPEIARSMVDLARAKGWDCIKVAGTADFKREVWLYAAGQGLQVSGYKPSELDLLKLQQLQDDVKHVVQGAVPRAPAPQAQAEPQAGRETPLQALERNNTELMPVAKDALEPALARDVVAQDVALFRAIGDAGERQAAALVIGDNARGQAHYAEQLQQQAPDVAGQVADAMKQQAMPAEGRGTAAAPAKEQPQQELGIAPASDLPPPLSPRHLAALDAMEVSLRRSHHSEAQIRAAIEFTRKDWTNDRVYVGRVVEHGAANYDFKPEGSPSYYVRLEDPRGAKFLLWGVDLPRALQASAARDGEDLVVSFQGAKKVDVPVVVDGDQGRQVRYESVDRNVWSITPVRELAPQAARAVSERALRNDGPNQLAVKRALQQPVIHPQRVQSGAKLRARAR